MTVPGIGVTLGDPGGVGPEVVLKSLAGWSQPNDIRIVVFGERRIVDTALESLNIGLELVSWTEKPEKGPGIYLKDLGVSRGGPSFGGPGHVNGEASFRFFEEAVEAARLGQVQAVVTAPISKASWRLAGIPWRGHTEYLEHFYPGAVMSFWSDRLKVALFTHHLPLKEALGRIRREKLIDFFKNLCASLEKVRGSEFELFVSGLNPHAGEEGLLGPEDEEIIRPSVEAARAEGIRISGPYPPDTVFLKARDRKDAMAVALYHDQGLIAFKILAFETGVNVTLGLPFLRTSPDHGTAFEIAGKGIADPRSMSEALKFASSFTAAAS